MQQNMGSMEFESRREVDVLQNVIEKALNGKDLNDEERDVAEKTSAVLEAIYLSW